MKAQRPSQEADAGRSSTELCWPHPLGAALARARTERLHLHTLRLGGSRVCCVIRVHAHVDALARPPYLTCACTSLSYLAPSRFFLLPTAPPPSHSCEFTALPPFSVPHSFPPPPLPPCPPPLLLPLTHTSTFACALFVGCLRTRVRKCVLACIRACLIAHACACSRTCVRACKP